MAQPSHKAPPARVIVADDDPDAVRSLIALLELEGFQARGVYSGLAVVEEVQSFGADAVLLDIGMPNIDGYGVARELRSRYASAKPMLIAVTARSSDLDRTLARAAGFEHHVSKPYRPADLIRLLEPLRGRV